MSQSVIPFRSAPVRPSWQDRFAVQWQRLRGAWADRSTQRQLAMLDDRSLSDIGISRAQAQFLSEQPVWALRPDLYR